MVEVGNNEVGDHSLVVEEFGKFRKVTQSFALEMCLRGVFRGKGYLFLGIFCIIVEIEGLTAELNFLEEVVFEFL